MEKIASKVFRILVENPLCRDDDRLLICEIWKREMKDHPNEDTLQMFQIGKLSHPETIRRIRQKTQEKFSSLRGDNYDKRRNIQKVFLRELACV